MTIMTGRTAPRPISTGARWGTLLALAVLTGTGCGNPLAPELLDDLEQAERLWAEGGPEHYEFTYRNVCFCALVAVRVEVRDEVVIAMEPVGPDQGPGVPEVEPLTVEGLHARIRVELERKPHAARIEYHPTLGYPVDVFFDYEEFTSDEEWGFRVEDFTALP